MDKTTLLGVGWKFTSRWNPSPCIDRPLPRPLLAPDQYHVGKVLPVAHAGEAQLPPYPFQLLPPPPSTHTFSHSFLYF